MNKQEYLKYLKRKNKPEQIDELFNPDGVEISGDIPQNTGGDEIRVEPNASSDRMAKQAMNRRDNFMFGAMNNSGVTMRRESFERVFKEELNKIVIKENKNTKQVKLTLTDIGLGQFNKIPTFKNMLHPNQIKELKIGDNILTVNHYIFSKLQQAQGYSPGNINVEEINGQIKEDANILDINDENNPTDNPQVNELENLKNERPDVFVVVEDFVSDIKSFEITEEQLNSINQYISNNLK